MICLLYTSKENVKEAMAVPVKYDNVISAGDRQILYKVVSMECDTDYAVSYTHLYLQMM